MKDPNDFTASFQDLIDSLEDRLRFGVEQPASIIFFFKRDVPSYELPAAAVAVTRVTGMVGRRFTVFEAGADYRFSGNRLIWGREGAAASELVFADEGSRLGVEFTYRDLPSGLTDFNPGSVAGALLRAFARELTLLYDQMDQAYRRAFIDEANGVALDNVVALLGVARNPAQKAVGSITFFRKRAATQTVVISAGAKVTDQSGRVFVTTGPGRIEIENEEITSNLRVRNRIAEIVGVWLKEDDPQAVPPIPAAIDDDDRQIKSATTPLPAGDLRVRYKPKSVTAPLEALQPGPDGNVNAGTITIMPTPPPNIDGATNEEPMRGGLEAESDGQLRDRAKHWLERSGNSTLNAIKFAALDVDGVQGVEVIDHQADETIPLGEVRVRYSGGDRNQVNAVVDKTRAAGVMARLDEIVEVAISGVFFLLPSLQTPPAASAKFLQAAIDAIQALSIGEPLSIRRVNSLVYNVTGLADVAEAALSFRKQASDPLRNAPDPLLVSRAEVVRPDKANLKAVVLVALQATADRKEPPKFVIDLQIIGADNLAAEFRSFKIDLNVSLRADLKEHPDQPPERIGSFTRQAQFIDGATAQLTIEHGDLDGFNSADHQKEVEFVITAAAYPGLRETKRKIDITV